MTQIQALPSTSTGKCCQSLAARLAELELRLLQETERRENDYNDLLRLFLSQRREITKEHPEPTHRKREQSKGSRTQTAPSARKETLKVALNRRVSHKHKQPLDLTHENKSVNLTQEKKSTKLNTTYKITTPHGTPEIPTSEGQLPNNLQERVGVVEGGLNRQLQETQKIKELNDYLMEQLLVVFEKIKVWEEKWQLSKGIASEETVTSVVMDQEPNDFPKSKINSNNNCSSSRLSQSDFSKADLGEIAAKVAEHESVLSELIQLTKGLTIGLGSDPKNSPEWQVPHHP